MNGHVYYVRNVSAYLFPRTCVCVCACACVWACLSMSMLLLRVFDRHGGGHEPKWTNPCSTMRSYVFNLGIFWKESPLSERIVCGISTQHHHEPKWATSFSTKRSYFSDICIFSKKRLLSAKEIFSTKMISRFSTQSAHEPTRLPTMRMLTCLWCQHLVQKGPSFHKRDFSIKEVSPDSTREVITNPKKTTTLFTMRSYMSDFGIFSKKSLSRFNTFGKHKSK